MVLEFTEKQMITLDVAELIKASGETAELLRTNVVGGDQFAGHHKPVQVSQETVPIEFQQLSPDDLKQLGADGLCSMLSDTDVRENDVLVFEGSRYTVSGIKRVKCFGAVSHLQVKLEREYVKP